MAQSFFTEDLHVQGDLSCMTFNAPANSVNNAAIQSAADVDASKLEHQYQPAYTQNGTTTAAAAQSVIHVAKSAGTIIGFSCSCRTKMTAGGSDDRSVTFDFKKNGTSVLSAAVVLSKANLTADMLLIDGTINTSAYVADDVLEFTVAIAGSVGTQALGPFAFAVLREAA